MKLIRGAGGGGESDQHTPVEAPDSLQSRATARVLDLIGEGEIEGLVDGLKSVYLDETPVQAADDTMNFTGVTVNSRNGTQAQTHIAGFDTQDSEVAVGVRIKKATPIVRTITNPDVDQVRVTVGVPGLSIADQSNGDVNGYVAEIRVEVQASGGSYTTVIDWDVIRGKTRSRYQRSYLVPLTGSAPWNIRVTRLTADSLTATITNETWWDSYTEIIDTKLTFPNSAVVGLTFDSKLFQTMPSRAYDVKLLRVKIPSNYNPITRAYTGVWDGTFVVAWTDNPAWAFYDLITTTRYGLGSYIPEALTDKWVLYAIGRYCDGLVNDGKGGTEPRFTINAYMQERADAYKVINDLASVFRGMVYWSMGSIFAVQDSPSDPVKLFNQTNVIGDFGREGTGRKARHTVAIVSWNNPDDFYRSVPEYVEAESTDIARFGIRETSVTAFGCASQGQARRVGRWILYTEKYESEVITWRTGMDAAFVRPGQIVEIMDPDRSTVRRAGRIVSATSNSVTIDAPFTVVAATVYTLTVVQPDGTLLDRTLNNGVGATSVLTFASALPTTDIVQAVWTLADPTLTPEYVRVMALTEDSPTTFKIVGVEHYPDKFAAVENDLFVTPPVTSDLRLAADPVTNLGVGEYLYDQDGVARVRMVIYFTASARAERYFVSYRRANGNWINLPPTAHTDIELDDVVPDDYEISVVSVNALGRHSPPETTTYTVLGRAGQTPDVVPNVAGLEIFGLGNVTIFTGRDCKFVWRDSSTKLSYDLGAEPNGAGSGAKDYYFNGYEVKILTTAGAILRTERVWDPIYTYTYEKNFENNAGAPVREFVIQVRQLGRYNQKSVRAAIMHVSNPQPALPTGVSLTSGFKQVFLRLTRPNDTDWDGVLVWMSTVPGFTPADANLAYKGPNTSVPIVGVPGTTYYLRYASFDSFGVTGVTMSGELTVTVAQIVSADLAAQAVQASHLYVDLATRIDLVDGDALMTGSVAQRVAAEAAARASAVTTEATTRAADLLAEVTARGAAVGTLQSQIDLLAAASTGDLADLIAAVATESTARADGDTAEAALRTTLATQMRGAYTGTDVTLVTTGLIYEERVARANAVAAEASARTTLAATVAANTAAITTEATARASADTAISATVTALTATVAGNTASITSEATTRSSADSSLASGLSTLSATVTSNYTTVNAAITTEATARASADIAIASTVTTLSSTVGTHTTSISTQATTIGGLSAQYTVKIDNNGYVSGYGLASLAVNGTITSTFIVRADVFAIGYPGASTVVPFIVSGGVTYIDQARIKDADITTLKIAGNAVTLPMSAYTAADIGVSTETTIQTLSVTTTGMQVELIGSANVISGNACSVSYTLYRDPGNVQLTSSGIQSLLGSALPESRAIPFADTPAAGTYTYTLRMEATTAVTASNRFLGLKETKR